MQILVRITLRLEYKHYYSNYIMNIKDATNDSLISRDHHIWCFNHENKYKGLPKIQNASITNAKHEEMYQIILSTSNMNCIFSDR